MTSANLSLAKIRVVLISAALIDDIVVMVIAATVKQLAPADAMTSFNRATIAQPILVYLAVIIIPIPLVWYILAPCYMRLLMHVLIAMFSF